jgi:uncharacterized protein YjbI with pentapeptide repeats
MKLKEAYEAYKNFKVPSLSEIRDTASKHSKTSLIIIIFLVTLLLLALQYIPHYQVAQFNITNQKDLAAAENSYRATLAQIFGGVAIAIGIYYTGRRITIAEEDLKATKDGQITERFTRAIDQLGNKKIEIRIGGIYALERISDGSDQDYWPIMEILTAYVRNKLPAETIELKRKDFVRMDIRDYADLKNKHKLPLDIQIILTVIGRRKYSCYTGEVKCLDLNKTKLSGADLTEAHLEEANLENADLQFAKLLFTNLMGAYLKSANLCHAHLYHTYLHKANLKNTNIRETTITSANFTNSNLQDADLQGAHIYSVNFEGADFGADEDFSHSSFGDWLEGATLEYAYISKSHFKNANLKKANLKRSTLDNVYFEGANLEGANFEGASLEGTYLKGAKNITIDQLSKAKTLYNAKLDEELENELRAKYPHLFDEPSRGPIIIEELKDKSEFIPS